MDDIAYTDELRFRCTPQQAVIVRKAARQDGLKPSEYLRRLVDVDLKDRSFASSRSAGELYDLMEGQRRYALVTPDGAVQTMSYHAEDPGLPSPALEGAEAVDVPVWLPVVHEDSEPFDIAVHWRLAPTTRVEASRVVVTFPVVDRVDA